MFDFNHLLNFTFIIILAPVLSWNGNIVEPWNVNILKSFYDKHLGLQSPKVKIQVYYECLCPYCRNFDTTTLKSTVEQLADYLDIHLYPYGNAETYINNGKYEFKCQHGEEECYGNKLHACGIDYLGNMTASVFFTSCLMDYNQDNKGSDDKATDVCCSRMGIDANAIKTCAKGDKGSLLLKQYGEESKAAGFTGVPYILINGVENDGTNFMETICANIPDPPPACQKMA